jgi:hypothetical protein
MHDISPFSLLPQRSSNACHFVTPPSWSQANLSWWTILGILWLICVSCQYSFQLPSAFPLFECLLRNNYWKNRWLVRRPISSICCSFSCSDVIVTAGPIRTMVTRFTRKRPSRSTRKGLQSKRATASLLIKTNQSCRKNRVCCCSGAKK